MKIAISKYTASNWYFVGVLLVMAVTTYLIMPDMDNTAEAGSGLSMIAVMGLAALQVPLLAYIIYHRYRVHSSLPPTIPLYILFFYVYFAWMTIVTLLNDTTHNFLGLIAMSLTILVFPFMLSCSYFRARTSELDFWFYSAVLLMMVGIAVQYMNIYSLANFLNEDGSHIGVSYFPLFILPILLLPSSVLVRLISTAITAIIIISSVKRGGIIALAASLMVYIFVKQYVGESSTAKKIIIISTVLIAMTGTAIYISQQEEGNVIERISNLKDDGGSDRDVLWKDTYYNILNRDLGFQIVGMGYRSAQKESVYQLPAHNDALEIWYDFGIIGLALYSIAFISLCLYTLRMLRRKSRYAPHMAMMITFYFFLSMISIVILYFWMAHVMLVVGILTGLEDRELAENKKRNAIEPKKAEVHV